MNRATVAAMRLTLTVIPALLMTACSGSDSTLVAEEEPGTASDNILCALGEETEFTPTCTLQRFYDAGQTRLILGRGDSGYRRFIVTDDGRGVITSDGAEIARVVIVADNQAEITVGRDRYRLPATIGSGDPQPEQ